MKKGQPILKFLLLGALAFLGMLPTAQAQEKLSGVSTLEQTMISGLLANNAGTHEASRENAMVGQAEDRSQGTDRRPDRGHRRRIELFILIDDSAQPSLGAQLADLRAFINAQPGNTSVGVGYMRNGTVHIAQNLTTDHNQAARALRLPMASSGAHASPYLSVMDLIKRWPQSSNRREVVMVTDGIDRFRSGPPRRGPGFISPDVDSASRAAQRTGTTVHTIFTRGVGRLGNNHWEIINGQNALAKLSNQTGGQSYYQGTRNAVSFKPYLDDLQKNLHNKYALEFRSLPSKKPALIEFAALTREAAGQEVSSTHGV
jgi:hypothetical protein